MTVLIFAMLFAAGLGAVGWMSSRGNGPGVLLVFFLGMPLFLGTTGLLLADAGRYSLLNLGLLTGIWAFSGLWRLRKAPRIRIGRRLIITILLLGLVCAALFSRPHTYLHGGWDPGEYISTSAQIHRTGSIGYTEPLLRELPKELYPTFCRNPVPPRPTLHAGFLILDPEAGAMVPDYFHLYPSWLALFNSIDGVSSAYLGQTVIAVIAILTVFLFLRMIAGQWIALMAAAALLANPATLYFARFPTSELLSMTLVFGCLFFVCQRKDDRDSLTVLWIGLTAFAATLCHITNMLPLAAMVLAAGIHGLYHRNKSSLMDAAALALGMGLGTVRNAMVTPLFTGFLVKAHVINRPGYILGLTLAALFAVAIGFILVKNIRPRLPDLLRHPLLWQFLFGVAVLMLGLYHYFLRPMLGSGPDVINLRSLGWLFSPLGLGLVFTAFFLLPLRKLTRGQILFLAAGGLTALILLQGKFIQPYYMWAFRRYQPMVIPFFATLLAYTLWRIAHIKFRVPMPYLAGMVFMALLGWQISHAGELIRIQEHKGLPAHVEALAASIPKSDFILIDHWKLSTPLRIAFGLPVYQLSCETGPVDEARQDALYSFLLGKLEAGESVTYVTHARPFYLPGHHPEFVASLEHQADILRWQRHGIPHQRQVDNSSVSIYRFMPGQDRGFDHVEFDIGYHSIGLIKGFHEIRKHRDQTARWTNGDAALYIPGMAKGGRLTLTVAHGRPAELAETLELELFLDNEPLEALTIRQDWAEYSVDLPPTDQATQKLTLRSPTWDPLEFGITGYAHDLGVNISHIRVTR